MAWTHTSSSIYHGNSARADCLPLRSAQDWQRVEVSYCFSSFLWSNVSLALEACQRRRPPSSITRTPTSKPYASGLKQPREFFPHLQLWSAFPLAGFSTCVLQWLGGEWCDVAIPVLEQLCTSSHTHNPWSLQGRSGMKARRLQQRLQAFQAGRSKGLHLRAQILRCSLREKTD